MYIQLGKFGKAEDLPENTSDKNWLWYVNGRAAADWATPVCS